MKIIDKILDFAFPQVCVCCKRILPHNTTVPFCSDCFKVLPTYKLNEAKPLGNIHVERCYCLYKYKRYDVKGIIFHAKSIFSKLFGKFIAREMKEKLKKHNLLNRIDVITYAPRKKLSVRKYGFDQGKELAKFLSKETSIPYDDLILRKGKASEQKFLSSAEREQNVKNLYHFNKIKNINQKTVLIVDDVITTGSTVSTCAKILKENGAKLVFALSIAD